MALKLKVRKVPTGKKQKKKAWVTVEKNKCKKAEALIDQVCGGTESDDTSEQE